MIPKHITERERARNERYDPPFPSILFPTNSLHKRKKRERALIHSGERWDRVHLRVKGSSNNRTVSKLDPVRVDVALHREGVLHPGVVQSIREVLARVSSSRFFPCFGGNHSLVGAGQQVSEFESLDEIADKGRESQSCLPI